MAFKAFQMAFSMDESRYEGFFAVAQALIDKDDCDQAADCLDTIIPILIYPPRDGTRCRAFRSDSASPPEAHRSH